MPVLECGLQIDANGNEPAAVRRWEVADPLLNSAVAELPAAEAMVRYRDIKGSFTPGQS